MLLQMLLLHSFLWLSSILVCVCVCVCTQVFFPQNNKTAHGIVIYLFLVTPMACGSSQGRDRTHATAVT